METLENTVLEFFLLINEINARFCKFKIDDLYTKKIYNQVVDMESNHKKLKEICNTKWRKMDLKKIIHRIFPISQQDDEKYPLTFFSKIVCPYCYSDLIVPKNSNFSRYTDIDMTCKMCHENFSFKDIIQNQLENWYSYEIMKCGSKGGLFPLKKCSDCVLGSFLVFEEICIYCGNKTEPEPQDATFEIEIYKNNVGINS